MVEQKLFLRSEVFSHTMAGTPWINFEWLSQVLLYLVVKYLGLGAVLYGKVFFALGILAVLAFVLRRFGARGPALFFMVFAGFMILKPRLYERIELVTLLFFPLFIYLLAVARTVPREARTLVPWLLFILMVLWCNMHAGFIYGIGAVVLFTVGAWWSKESAEYRSMLHRSLVLSLAAFLINPYGLRIVNIFVDHLDQLFNSPAVIQEWAPVSARDNPFFWLVFFISCFAIFTGLANNIRRAKFWTPVVLVFLVWGARYVRNAALAAIVVLPFLADFFSGDGPWKNALSEYHLNLWRKIKWLPVFILLFYLTPMMIKPAPRETLQENRFPIGTCKFIRAQGITGTMYNTYELGGYIEWALPDHKVFMDGRYLFHPLLLEHLRLDNALFENPRPDGWQEFLKSHGVDYAIVDYGPFNNIPSKGSAPFPFVSANLMFPRSNWALVYWDDSGLLFLKRSAFTSIIEKFEYQALWPYNLDQMQALLNSGLVPPGQAEKELQRHQAEVPISIIRSQLEQLVKATVSKTP